MKLTAFKTPFHLNLELSWSLNSKASCFPVDAPEGTYASDELLSESITSAATVGFPRESKTSKAKTSLIVNLVTINLSLSLEKFLLTYQYYLPDLKILLHFVRVRRIVHRI